MKESLEKTQLRITIENKKMSQRVTDIEKEAEVSKTRDQERKDYIDSRIASFETTQTVLLDGVAKQIPWKNKVGEDIFTLNNRVNELP